MNMLIIDGRGRETGPPAVLALSAQCPYQLVAVGATALPRAEATLGQAQRAATVKTPWW